MTVAKPPLMDMIQGLINTPSISCVKPELDMGNVAVIELLATWLVKLGFKTEIQYLDDQHHKANLIATLGSGPGGLVLAGHTDTVPCNEELWTSSPFEMTERDNRLYGLGTSDMKSFLALAIEAACAFDAKQFNQPLIILATADEETSMSGAKAIVEKGYPKARYAVIGEPTGLKPVRTHKGIMMEAIRLTGQSGHSSNPAYGANALEAMHDVITELKKWRNELQQQYNSPLFEVPVPTMNFGHIHGGDNPNRICGECELHIDIRPLPGMNIDELRHELNQRLKRSLTDPNIKLSTMPLFEGIPAMETPAESKIVKAAEQLTNYTASAVAFGTEAPYFNELGMESIILGPGNIAQAHQPDEYLDMSRITPTVMILKNLIIKFCLMPN